MNMNRSLPLIATLLLAAGCTSIHRFDSTQLTVITVPQGIQNPDSLQDVTQRLTNGLPVVFKVANGERMPFKLEIELPMGALEKSSSAFVFNRDTYFLLSQKGMQLSPDGQRWADITSPRSLSKLFGFKHGSVAFGFSSGTNETPFINMVIKVN